MADATDRVPPLLASAGVEDRETHAKSGGQCTLVAQQVTDATDPHRDQLQIQPAGTQGDTDLGLMQRRHDDVVACLKRQHKDETAALKRHNQDALAKLTRHHQDAMAEVKGQRQHDIVEGERKHQDALEAVQRQLKEATEDLKQHTQNQANELRRQKVSQQRESAAQWRLLAQVVKDYRVQNWPATLSQSDLLQDLSVFESTRQLPIIEDDPVALTQALDTLTRWFDSNRLLFDPSLTSMGNLRRFCALRLRSGERLREWLEDAYADGSIPTWQDVRSQAVAAMKRLEAEETPSITKSESSSRQDTKKRKA